MKYGQAEYLEKIAKAFVEHKLDKILEESEKHGPFGVRDDLLLH